MNDSSKRFRTIGIWIPEVGLYGRCDSCGVLLPGGSFGCKQVYKCWRLTTWHGWALDGSQTMANNGRSWQALEAKVHFCQVRSRSSAGILKASSFSILIWVAHVDVDFVLTRANDAPPTVLWKTSGTCSKPFPKTVCKTCHVLCLESGRERRQDDERSVAGPQNLQRVAAWRPLLSSATRNKSVFMDWLPLSLCRGRYACKLAAQSVSILAWAEKDCSKSKQSCGRLHGSRSQFQGLHSFGLLCMGSVCGRRCDGPDDFKRSAAWSYQRLHAHLLQRRTAFCEEIDLLPAFQWWRRSEPQSRISHHNLNAGDGTGFHWRPVTRLILLFCCFGARYRGKGFFWPHLDHEKLILRGISAVKVGLCQILIGDPAQNLPDLGCWGRFCAGFQPWSLILCQMSTGSGAKTARAMAEADFVPDFW